VYTQASPINSPHNTDFRWLDLSDTEQFMAYLIASRGIEFRLTERQPGKVRVGLHPITSVRRSEFYWLSTHKDEVVALLRAAAHTPDVPKGAE
jgi:hypothetical protein